MIRCQENQNDINIKNYTVVKHSNISTSKWWFSKSTRAAPVCKTNVTLMAIKVNKMKYHECLT